MGLHPLQEVGHLDVRVAVAAVGDPERRPKSASASSKKRIALDPSAAAKMRSRFCSVSPTYFETTVARSTENSSSPRSPASTLAAIVLPVPLSPANSTPSP